MLPKDYYPTHALGCHPIHEVKDWCKVRKLVRDALRGDKINPIVIEGQKGSGSMITGTHRAAANDLLVMLGHEALINHISVDDLDNADEIRELLAQGDYDQINYLLDDIV